MRTPRAQDTQYAAPRHITHQFLYGDCVALAHALAVLNPGWGTIVVGEATEYTWGDDTDETYWDAGTIQHAWATRPDGALVDITGVHARTVAEDLAKARNLDLHEHTGPDAATQTDHVWAATLMEPAGEEDPAEVAMWVMKNWGTAPTGTVVTVLDDEDLVDEDLDD